MKNKEELIHQEVWNFIQANKPKHPHLAYWYHTPNGGFRDVRTAVRLSKMGVQKGVPDLMHPLKLALELKAPGGRLSSDQERWRDYLLSIGYYYFATDSAVEAKEWIKETSSWYRDYE